MHRHLHVLSTAAGAQIPVNFRAIQTDTYVLWSIQNMQLVYQHGAQMAQAQFQDTLHAFSSERALLMEKIEQSEAERRAGEQQGAAAGGVKFMQYEHDHL